MRSPSPSASFLRLYGTAGAFVACLAGSVLVAPGANAATPRAPHTSSTVPTGQELLDNGGFESPTLRDDESLWVVPEAGRGWQHTGGQVEMWGRKAAANAPHTGNQLIELDSYTRVGDTVYQTVDVTPGTQLRWSVAHQGRYGPSQMQVVFGTPDQKPAEFKTVKPDGQDSDTISTGTGSWTTYRGGYVLPEGQTKLVFGFTGVSLHNLLDSASLVAVAPPTVTTSASAQSVQRGGKIGFTTKAANSGDWDLQGVTLTQELPAHAGLVPGSVRIDGRPAGEQAAEKDGKLVVHAGKDGALAPNAATTLSYELRLADDAPAGTKLTQRAAVLDHRIAGSDTAAPSVRGGEAVVALASADLGVTGLVTPLGGTKAQYQVRVTNDGPDAAHGVQFKGVSDVSLTGLTLRLESGECSAEGDRTATCTLPVLDKGASATMTVEGEFSGGKLPDVAASVGSRADDPRPGNNTTTLAAATADVGVELTADPKETEPGSDVAFTLKVTNKGPAAAEKVRVDMELPDGFTPPEELKDLGSLAVDESRTVKVTGTAGKDAEKLVARATVGTDAFDPNLKNQMATAEVKVAGGGDEGAGAGAGAGDKSEEGEQKDEGLLALTGANGRLLLALGGGAMLAAAAGTVLVVRSRKAARSMV
ncbi:CARDB domain-containing protein [Streptomyces sp. NBC_00096]|uniref:CARDB domain-containing protein n=1 Tax=Streptomyces sp. NBC_00096 TaxID=2975650 RepID=UPI00324EC416